MALELILGPAAGGKTTYLQQEIQQIAVSNPQQSVIYIVPEQTTLKVQQQLLKKMPGHSMLGTEILSFNRLAHRIFGETGMPQKTLLDDMGKCMVLYKLARDHREELVYYGGSVSQRGFIGQLKLMITELFQYGLDEESLEELIHQQPEGSILAAKLQDIALLWKYFKDYTGEQVIASEAVLDLLAERIAQSKLIQDAYVYVDDFSGFTPQQYRVLTGIALRSKKLTVALSLTPAAFQAVQSVSAGEGGWRDLPRQLFFTTEKTAYKLTQLAKEYRIPLRTVWQQQRNRPEELTHVTEELCRPVPRAYPKPAERVRAFAAANQTEELRWIFHEICRLVQEEGYAYREIALVAADLEGYAHGIRRQMELYDMPGFIDEKMDISLTPYVQWLRGLGELIGSGFSEEALLSVLKTGLTGLSQEEIDRLENQALRENWWGRDRVLAGLREQDFGEGPCSSLADQLERFAENVKGRRSVQELTEAYQSLAKEQQIEEKLKALSQEMEQAGQLLKAMEYDRIFKVAEELQDRLCQVMGTVSMNLSEYAEILEIGISQSKMGQLPPSLDELLAADLSRSRLTSYRAVFFLGLQEGSFPKMGGADGLLTQRERSQAGEKMELAQGEKERLMEQYFLLYSAMGKAQERIYFSCSAGGSDGKAFGESGLWKRLAKTLGGGYLITEASAAPRPRPYLYEADRLSSGAAGKWLWQHGYQRELMLMQEAEKRQLPNRRLTAAMARRLMDPAQRLLSVTQLEQYARCPFSYYLQYGLYLKEREVPQVRSLEDGNVLHDLLQEAGTYLTRALEESEAMALAEKLAAEKQEEYHVYQTSGRYRYYWRKLQKAAARALVTLTHQLQKGDFQPEAFEWWFGPESGGGPVEVALADGRKVRLQGKIDRVDLWQQDEERYVRIIDYKSGHTEYKPEEIYAGLQLQLPVYLEAGEAAYRAKPAGFFYFHLMPGLQEGADEEKADWEKLLLKAGRLDGLFLNDVEVAAHMDRELMTDPLVMKAQVTKSGGFHKRNHTATPEQFALLQGFVHQKIQEIAEKMESGQISQEPAAWGANTACSFCQYRRACPFDERVPGSACRKVEKMSAEEFWDRIEQEGKGEKG